ncbi:MAG: M61 family metallopeptidase [Proteobacteria bacterium]|nr:M61 family metallopeptidase [Pseudomonadota bacterium]
MASEAASGVPEVNSGAIPDPAAGAASGAHVPVAQDVTYPGSITLKVELGDLDRKIFNVHESIPVKPGPLTLLYPEWLPGNHAPRGPIDDLAGLIISAGGHAVEWVRDPVNVYAFHVQVPPGATRLDLEFDYTSPLVRDQGRTVVAPDILGLQWNAVVLYPAGFYASRIPVAASITLPEGWEFAGALDVESRRGAAVRFKPTTLETLVDSPLFAGRYFRSLDLDPGAKIPVHLNVFADSAESLEVRPSQLAAHRKLVQETYAMLGPPHFDRYEFLLAISDHFGDIGLEHHRSSENRRPPNYFLEADRGGAGRDLLPHEFSHSWNGKFRRPAGLATPDFNVPMHNSLLWVYEGLTNYLGAVLAARSGLWSEDYARQSWASLAANMDRNRAGRTWRALEDTTEQPLITARRPLSWLSWQRTEDYYTEGELLWLDIDTRIREITRDRKSVDDFAKAFFQPSEAAGGSRGGLPGTAGIAGAVASVTTVNGVFLGPVTYTLADVIQALKAVAPFDWEKYLNERLYGHGPGAPIDGLARGGWKLVFMEVPSEYVRSLEEQRKAVDFTFSLGFSVSAAVGTLTEVRWGGPAYEAGLTLGTVLIAVNGREYRSDRLRTAIQLAKLNKQPIELLVKNFDRYRTVKIPYYEGLEYPVLQRLDKTEDRLAGILKPRT